MYHGLIACKEPLRHQIFTIQQNALILRLCIQRAHFDGFFFVPFFHNEALKTLSNVMARAVGK